MASKQLVYIEINTETKLPIRILKHFSKALDLPPECVTQMARSVAVGYIRDQIFERATRGKLILCEYCGKVITKQTGHMHEKIPKGKGGEVSLSNCVALCSECHIGPDGEHGDRKWGGKNESRN